MKNKKWVVAFILFIIIMGIGLFRVNVINNKELIIGTPTMTGEFTFVAYFIISVLISCIWLAIFKINSIEENILNRVVKNIFITTLLIIFIPIIIGVLIIFH